MDESPKRRMDLWEIIGLSGIAVLFVAIVIINTGMLDFLFHHEKIHRPNCTNNQKQIITAVHIYYQEHQNHLPPTRTFWDDIRIDKAALQCPNAPTSHNRYGVNSFADNLLVTESLPTDTILITADSDRPMSILYSERDIAYRHEGKAIASFLDGHVAQFTSLKEVGGVLKVEKNP